MPDWFVVNVADAPAFHNERGGASARFESPEARFPDFGINIRELQPGQPNGKYHSENVQEDFLVLSGSAWRSSTARSGRCAPGTSCTARPGPSTSSSARATGRATS